MKDVKMTNKNTQQNHFCKNCDQQLIYIPHLEFDYDRGSFEPDYECVKGCAYPLCKDSELTAEELMERNKVDTCTEFGIISMWDWQKGVTA